MIIKCLSLFILIGLVCPAIVFAQNKALSLDGDGDYVRVPHSKSLNLSDTVSLECRILRNSNDGKDESPVIVICSAEKLCPNQASTHTHTRN